MSNEWFGFSGITLHLVDRYIPVVNVFVFLVRLNSFNCVFSLILLGFGLPEKDRYKNITCKISPLIIIS